MLRDHRKPAESPALEVAENPCGAIRSDELVGPCRLHKNHNGPHNGPHVDGKNHCNFDLVK